MNENKTTLILKIARELTEDQCGMILQRIESNPILLANKLVRLANTWQESEHARHEDGRFAPNGAGRSSMNPMEKKKWDDIGRSSSKSKEITKIKSEIRKLEKERDKFRSKDLREYFDKQIVEKQRELAEAKRDRKKKLRLDLEDSVSKRVLKKKVKEYCDVDDEIDYSGNFKTLGNGRRADSFGRVRARAVVRICCRCAERWFHNALTLTDRTIRRTFQAHFRANAFSRSCASAARRR